MLGVNTETVVVSMIVCFSILLITIWMKDEADSSTGTTKSILTGISFSLDLANTILFVITFLVLIGVIIDVLSGGIAEEDIVNLKKKDRQKIN